MIRGLRTIATLVALCGVVVGCGDHRVAPTDPYGPLDEASLDALLETVEALGAEGSEDEPPPELDRPYADQAPAIAVAKQAVREDPRSRQARTELAKLYADAGRNDLARWEYGVLIHGHPRDPSLHLQYATQLWYERADPVQSLLHARAADALGLAPLERVDWAFLVASIAEAQDDVADAERLYREVAQLDPRNAEAIFRAGTLARARGDADEAERCFRDTLRRDPMHVRAHFALGNVLAQRGESSEAEQLLVRHARLRQLESLGFLREREAYQSIVLGNHAALAGDLDQALAEFTRAIELEPDNSDARSYLAAVLLDRGDVEQALREWKTVLQRDPRHGHALAALAGFHLGDGSEAERDPARGLDFARRAVKVTEGKDGRALMLLARGLAQSGDRAAAVQAIDRACALEPDRGDWQALRESMRAGDG